MSPEGSLSGPPSVRAGEHVGDHRVEEGEFNEDLSGKKIKVIMGTLN